MKEDLLHFVWNSRRFLPRNLTTTAGRPVEILEFGRLNSDAGPDFLNARIKIDGTLWIGNVEMHLMASDWHRHGHQKDPAYANVILHVVLSEDRPALRSDGSPIPCLELRQHLPNGLVSSYQRLLHTLDWIPCAGQIKAVDPILLNIWLEQMVVRRLEHKVWRLEQVLKETRGDWNEAAFRLAAAYLGAPVNKEPMEELARRVSLIRLQRMRSDPLGQEALLLGQAGLLEQRTFKDEFPQSLQKEFAFLKKKFDLQPMSGTSWKFSRMRPSSFPELRIVQLAELTRLTPRLMGLWMDAATPAEAMAYLEVTPDGYWKTHYRLDSRKGPVKEKRLGTQTLHSLIINTAVPLLFLYGHKQDAERWKEKSLDWLSQLPPENNKVIRRWKKLGVAADSAAQTQALIHLKDQYCETRACLQCQIGQKLLTEPLLNYSPDRLTSRT